MKTKRMLEAIFIALVVGIFGLEVLFRLLNHGGYGIILPFIARESFVIKRDAQISIMEREALERSANPPAALEVEQMKKDPKLCFHNDDCRLSLTFYSCNIGARNKYDTSPLVSTAIGCSDNRYSACEQNKCISKTVEPVIPYPYGY